MSYHGAQFRMARAAVGIGVREVCAGARVSMRTVARLEGAGPIEYGVREKDRFEPETVEKLVAFYEKRGVTFSPASVQGVGIRYRPPSK